MLKKFKDLTEREILDLALSFGVQPEKIRDSR